MKNAFLFSLFVLSLSNLLIAQVEFLDPSFADNGIAITDIAGDDERLSVVRILPDGKILAAGYGQTDTEFDFLLIRYLNDGTLDPSFGTGGVVHTDMFGDDIATALHVYEDGRYLLGGYFEVDGDNDFAMARYLNDGSLDPSFGIGGRLLFPVGSNGADDYANALLVRPDGKILISGQIRDEDDNQDFCILQFLPDGLRDNSFGTNGVLRLDLTFGDYPEGLALQPDGKILHIGTTWYNEGGNYGDFTLLRYNENGTLDSSFGDDGKVLVDYGLSLDFGTRVYYVDDKILASGISSDGDTGYDFTLLRFNLDGTLDATFGDNGRFKLDFLGDDDRVREIIPLEDGGFLLGGMISYETAVADFGLAKCTANGLLDTSFGVDGKIIIDIRKSDICRSISMQPDGKIIQGGYTRDSLDWDVVVARLFDTPLTNVNTSHALSQKVQLFPNPVGEELTIQWEDLMLSGLWLADQQGRLLQYWEALDASRLLLPTRTLSPGTYHILFESKRGLFSRSFVKQ